MKLPIVAAAFILAMTAAFMAIMVNLAKAEDCPKGASTCKVVTITPEEYSTLSQPGGVWDQAIWANRSGMTGIVEAWKKKIDTAPAGTVSQREPGVKADEQK